VTRSPGAESGRGNLVDDAKAQPKIHEAGDARHDGSAKNAVMTPQPSSQPHEDLTAGDQEFRGLRHERDALRLAQRFAPAAYRS
jgi:hypothetical protein